MDKSKHLDAPCVFVNQVSLVSLENFEGENDDPRFW